MKLWLLTPGILLILFFCTACSGSSANRKATYPVEGKVFHKDQSQPAVGALVVFRPVTGASTKNWPHGFPRATVQKDGSFKLNTYGEDDGAPAGEYAVLITWFPVDAKSEEEAGKDLLQGRYSRAKQPVWKKRVNAGNNNSSEFVFIVQ